MDTVKVPRSVQDMRWSYGIDDHFLNAIVAGSGFAVAGTAAHVPTDGGYYNITGAAGAYAAVHGENDSYLLTPGQAIEVCGRFKLAEVDAADQYCFGLADDPATAVLTTGGPKATGTHALFFTMPNDPLWWVETMINSVVIHKTQLTGAASLTRRQHRHQQAGYQYLRILFNTMQGLAATGDYANNPPGGPDGLGDVTYILQAGIAGSGNEPMGEHSVYRTKDANTAGAQQMGFVAGVLPAAATVAHLDWAYAYQTVNTKAA